MFDCPKCGKEIGDKVKSVGGFFTEGEILGVRQMGSQKVYKIRWIKDIRYGTIDLIQERAGSAIREI